MKGCAVLVFTVSIAVSANAQTQRTFVASTGLDTNPCSRTLPCRNFAAAVAATVAGGEVVALDSAGFGPVTIGSSVSLIAPAGVYAGVAAFSGDAITVNAGSTDTVVLRGLTLNGVGASNGINVLAYGRLHVENCVISRFSSGGLSVNAGNGTLVVTDTVARENGDGFVFFNNAILSGSFERCVAANNQYGFDVIAEGGVSITLHGCVATNNTAAGLYAAGGVLVATGCVSANNGTGVKTGTNFVIGIIALSGTTISGNGTGIDDSTAGSVESFGNNQLSHNTVAISGSITPVAQN